MKDCKECELYGECDHQGAYKRDGKWCYDKSIKVIDFTNIELSLKALKQVIVNQIFFSEANYIWASDVELSLDFINNLKETLILIEKLFGSLNEEQNACHLINGKIVNNFKGEIE